MLGSAIISALLRDVWLIDEEYASYMMPYINRIMSGERAEDVAEDAESDGKLNKALLPFVTTISAGLSAGRSNSLDQAAPGSISVIPIRGAIAKNDYCGSPGTSTMKAWLQQADQHPNVVAHLLLIDSPGGQVSGTFEFADAIAGAKKPVVAFVDGLAASAGYAFASSAKEIILSHQTAQVGSIGTAVSFYNNEKAMEQYGYKMVYINADTSPDKNQDYFEAVKGNTNPIKQGTLNPMNEVFMNTVKKNRAGKLSLSENNEPLTGKVYLAKTAIANGLADTVGTFEYALQRAADLAVESASSVTSKQSNTMKFNLKASLVALVSFLGFTVQGETTKEEFTDEHMEKLNTELTRLQGVEASFTQLKTESEGKDAKITDLTKQVNTLTTEKVDLQTKIAKLEKEPGAKSSSPIGGTGAQADQEDQEPLYDHDKAADSFLK